VDRKAPTEDIRQIGDPAPALTVQEWIKGKPVRIQPGTNIYVIVFCTLSRANEMALTNLTTLQNLYENKGLITVAVSDDSPEILRDFVHTHDADINFAVAADELGRRTTADFQRLFRQYRLPRAYVVGKDGNVLWFGHPLTDNLGQVVDDIVSGRYNLEQTKKETLARDQMDGYLMLARQDDTNALQAGRMMLRLRANDAPALCDLAFRIATDPYIEHRDVALANAALNRAARLSFTNDTDIAVDRAILLFQTGKLQAGLERAKQALAIAKTDDEKSEVNTCIHAMEARLAAAQTNQTDHANGTNAPAAPAK
jgi:hypothetical protein